MFPIPGNLCNDRLQHCYNGKPNIPFGSKGVRGVVCPLRLRICRGGHCLNTKIQGAAAPAAPGSHVPGKNNNNDNNNNQTFI